MSAQGLPMALSLGQRIAMKYKGTYTKRLTIMNLRNGISSQIRRSRSVNMNFMKEKKMEAFTVNHLNPSGDIMKFTSSRFFNGKEFDEKKNETNQNETHGLRTLARQYGSVGVVTYFGVYVTTLSSLYGLLTSGMVDAEFVSSWIQNLNIDEWIKSLHLNSFIHVPEVSKSASDFTAAWVLTKFTEPLRLGITVAITPSVNRLFRRKVAERKERRHLSRKR